MNTTIITAAGQSASHASNISGVAGGTVGLAALIAFGWLFHATHGGDKASPNSGRGAFLKSGKFKISIAFVLGGLVMTGGGFIANIFTHISSTIS
jgi:hypothetical protein